MAFKSTQKAELSLSFRLGCGRCGVERHAVHPLGTKNELLKESRTVTTAEYSIYLMIILMGPLPYIA